MFDGVYFYILVGMLKRLENLNYDIKKSLVFEMMVGVNF